VSADDPLTVTRGRTDARGHPLSSTLNGTGGQFCQRPFLPFASCGRSCQIRKGARPPIDVFDHVAVVLRFRRWQRRGLIKEQRGQRYRLMTVALGVVVLSGSLQTMGTKTMGRRLQIAFCAIAIFSAIGGQACAESHQFSCSGEDIEPVGLAKSPITAQLSYTPPDKISFDLGKETAKTTITGDNKITMTFHTPDFDGEYFKYTRDLFLVYHSGHLAKLSCTPK
jgi:hypothetical protein